MPNSNFYGSNFLSESSRRNFFSNPSVVNPGVVTSGLQYSLYAITDTTGPNRPVRYIRLYSAGSTSNTGNHIVEIQALTSGGTNRASGRTVTNAGGTTFPNATNGNTDSGDWADFATNSGYITVDLGQVFYDISTIKFWQYYADGRTYYNVTVSVSTDNSNWITVFGPQNQASNSSGISISNTTNGGYIAYNSHIVSSTDISVPSLTTTASVEIWAYFRSSGGMPFGWLAYDVYTPSGQLGYNTGNSDLYGISSATASSLGVFGNWKHYVFEMRSDVSYTNNKIYINGSSITLGQQSGSEAAAARNFNGGLGRIAGWRSGGYDMSMNVGAVRIYNRSLTIAEIQKNFTFERSIYGV